MNHMNRKGIVNKAGRICGATIAHLGNAVTCVGMLAFNQRIDFERSYPKAIDLKIQQQPRLNTQAFAPSPRDMAEGDKPKGALRQKFAQGVQNFKQGYQEGHAGVRRKPAMRGPGLAPGTS